MGHAHQREYRIQYLFQFVLQSTLDKVQQYFQMTTRQIQMAQILAVRFADTSVVSLYLGTHYLYFYFFLCFFFNSPFPFFPPLAAISVAVSSEIASNLQSGGVNKAYNEWWDIQSRPHSIMVVAVLGHSDIHYLFWFDVAFSSYFNVNCPWISVLFWNDFYFDNAVTFAFKFDFYFILLSIVFFPLFCSHVPFYFQFWFIFFFYF